jgi:zinc-binding alcohol dehydrogenase/oxidoreductase
MMNAIVLRETGGPEVLRLERVPDPVPGPGEVVVRLRAAALNRRDVWIRMEQYAGIRLPAILGSDGAGEVSALGEGVRNVVTGAPVIVNPSLDWGDGERVPGPAFRILGMPDDGTYAELVRVPAANLFPKPERLSWEEAAALPLAALTAYRAMVSRARVGAGETVLVTGIGGGVATFALLIARHLGARVLVTSGSEAKLERARALGAEGGADYHDPKWVEAIRRLAGGGGPDVAIDGTGGTTFAQLLDVLKPGGRLASYGATRGPAPEMEVRRLFWKQLDLLGTTMGSPRDFAGMVRMFTEPRHAGDRQVVNPLTPVVDQVFPLAEAAAAHRRMEAAEQFGKIVLRIGD